MRVSGSIYEHRQWGRYRSSRDSHFHKMLRLASRYWLHGLVHLRPHACNSCCGEVCLGGFGLGYICSLHGPMSYGRCYTLTS